MFGHLDISSKSKSQIVLPSFIFNHVENLSRFNFISLHFNFKIQFHFISISFHLSNCFNSWKFKYHPLGFVSSTVCLLHGLSPLFLVSTWVCHSRVCLHVHVPYCVKIVLHCTKIVLICQSLFHYCYYEIFI